MANSFQMAVRAGIMIVTMVAIPLLAIFGKQLPELIEGIYRGNVKTDEWQTRPATPVAGPVSNASVNQLAGQQQRADLTPAPAFQPGTNASSAPAYGLASKNLEPPPLATNSLQSAAPLPINPTNAATTSTLPRSNNLGQALPPSTLRDPYVSPAGLNRPAPSADLNSAAFQQGQQRLRELGASYFKLETTGEPTERYRAVCQIAAPNGPVQNFTSIHSDALTALNDVISQIEGKRETAQAFPSGALGIQR